MSSALQGLNIWLCVFGCRSNLYESEALANGLTSRGALIADKPEGADAAVIISCSVTAVADKKCRQAVRRARRAFSPVSPGKNSAIAVCGCWAQGLDAAEARDIGIDILIGNRLKNRLPDVLENFLANRASGHGGTGENKFIDIRLDFLASQANRQWDGLSLERPLLRTRAFLKVQEGCDHFCSYCVIPFLRGRSASRPMDEVLSEAARVVNNGCKEIILTGIHLGDYGSGSNTSITSFTLAKLIEKLSAMPGIVRLRLGSLEPFALDAELLDALASSPVFCRHLHLPMQSGDDEVLARMRRGYRVEDFLRVCESARRALGEDLHISSDIMAAFPGETDAMFENTLAAMEEARLGRVHVFPYSPRKGTEAAAFPNRVPSVAASERVKAAIALGESLLERYASRFVGRTLPVLIEDGDEKGSFTGYTENFVSAVFGSKIELEAGTVADARIIESDGGKLLGVRV